MVDDKFLYFLSQCINILRFYLRKLSSSERNYSPTEKEGLAVTFAIMGLKSHISAMRPKQSEAFYWSLRAGWYHYSRWPTTALAVTRMRWILHIQQISGLRIHEREGKRMVYVDAWTRLHIGSTTHHLNTQSWPFSTESIANTRQLILTANT